MSSIKQKVEEVLGTSGKGQTVLISGGSGFVAAWVLNAFLSRGYRVRTTVRTPETAENVKKSHKKYLDQLEFAIVKDITVPGAFDEAVKGVDGVVHTASPFVLEVKDNVKDLLDPAIKGTVGILASIKEHNPKVKRVVITSSFAAIIDIQQGARPNYIYTEKDWNPVTYEQASNKDTPGAIAYCASKTFAEKAAFEFVEKENPNFAVTTINPPMVYGPAAHTVTDLSKLNTSSAEIYRLINGSEKEVPSTQFFVWCDVRDVGEAHALAYESLEAAGERFAVTGGTYTFKEVCDIIRKDFPSKKSLVPELTKEDPDPKETYTLSNEKAQKVLGMKFRTLEESIKDQVEEFVEIEKRVGKE